MRLRQLISSGRLHLHSFPLSLDGIAYDCIAELFQRDDEGRFFELEECFTGEYDMEKLTSEQALQRFRVVVFNKLQHGIIRLYKETDPVLAKIIRNVKLSIQHCPTFHTYERFGQTYLHTCTPAERNDEKPEASLETLEQWMSALARKKDTVPAMLGLFFTKLDNQCEYRRSLSIVDTALVMKRVMTAHHAQLSEPINPGVEMMVYDIQNIIRESICQLDRQLTSKYVETGKMTRKQLRAYFGAVQDIITETFERNNGSVLSHAEYLRTYLPDMTVEEYREKHRTHFEYIVRKSKKFVADKLKELL